MPGASCRKVSISSTTKSAPAVACSSAKRAGSMAEVMSCSLACLHAVERLDQLLDADRLGDVVVHAGGQAHLAVAGHGVGGHRDDARARILWPLRGDAARSLEA